MTNRESSWWTLDNRPLPFDLVVVLVLLFVSNLSMLLPGVRATPLRVPLGFVLLLFLPGYVFTAVLFPESVESPSEQATVGGNLETLTGRGLDGSARVLLSIVSSLVIVMATALALDVTGTGITLGATLLFLDVFVVLGTVIATVRRAHLRPERRLSLPVRQWAVRLRDDATTFDRVERFLAIALIVFVLLAVAGAVYTASVPGQDDRYTEFYLLQENQNGTFTASDYVDGGSGRLAVGVSNHEHRAVNYTVIVRLQQVETRSSSGAVLRSRELDRFAPKLEHGETQHSRHMVRFNESWDHARLVYLLYRGSPPDNPTRENAYRELYLWVTTSPESTP